MEVLAAGPDERPRGQLERIARHHALNGALADRPLAGHDRPAVVLQRRGDQFPAAGRLPVHEYDDRMEDLSPSAIAGFCAELDRMRAALSALEGLSVEDAVERDVFFARIDGLLFDYRTLRAWERDPYSYAEVLSSQLNTTTIFEYASKEDRLRSIIAKEAQIPRFLEQAKRNLKPTAPMLVNYGIRGAEGALSLVRRDLPKTFGSVTSPELRSEFEASTTTAAEAIEGFVAWLRSGYPAGDPRGYALGRDVYSGWLASGERIVESLESLESWGVESIEETRESLRKEASRLDPKADPAVVVARITSDHPATGGVVSAARKVAEDVYRWIEARKLVTLPTAERVLIADTPDFMRWSFGSMWTPGPYERADVRATFYATDADPSWPIDQQNEHLTAFCYRGLENLAIHEAYPGHFIQGLHQNRVASDLRKSFWWGVFGEGWAHYCEQVAVDEGFGDGAPEVRIIQLQEALNRLCRFVNGIRLHTDPGWDFVRGTKFFVEKAWLAEAVARAECERGAFDPFYLRYTLGKKEILDLREECRRKLGPRFDLRRFHDALLCCRSGPMPDMKRLTRLALGVA